MEDSDQFLTPLEKGYGRGRLTSEGTVHFQLGHDLSERSTVNLQKLPSASLHPTPTVLAQVEFSVQKVVLLPRLRRCPGEFSSECRGRSEHVAERVRKVADLSDVDRDVRVLWAEGMLV